MPRPETWLKRNDATIKFVLAVLGILIGINEYLQRQHDDRVQRSLKIYERYQAKEVLDARIGIDRVWNTGYFWEQLIERHEDDGRLYFDNMSELVEDVVADREVIDDLFVVWTISSEASLCLRRGQCDQVTVCQSFWHETQKYFLFFEPYFDARNIAWDETVQNRERIANTTLEEFCGNKKYMKLYRKCREKDGWTCSFSRLVRRYYHEAFNDPVGV